MVYGVAGPNLSDPNRPRLWLAVARPAPTGLDAVAAWQFWRARLGHLAFARHLVQTGRLTG